MLHHGILPEIIVERLRKRTCRIPAEHLWKRDLKSSLIWSSGSNTHNNRGGGDGQAGDDGEGKGGKKTTLIIHFYDENFLNDFTLKLCLKERLNVSNNQVQQHFCQTCKVTKK